APLVQKPALPCAIRPTSTLLLMSCKKGFVRMQTTTRTHLALAHDTVLISTRGDEARLDEPASLLAMEEQSHPAWLSQLQLYDRAFALAQDGITGPALATALT